MDDARPPTSTKGDGLLPAVSVAVRREDRLLLVLRGREPAKGLHAFPGGRVEAGETFEEAARRELREETGIIAGPLAFVSELDLPETSPAFRLHVFTAMWADGEPVAGDDAASAGWYTLEQMEGLPMTASTLIVARTLLG